MYVYMCYLGKWWKTAPEYPQPLPNLSSKYFTSDDYIEIMVMKKVYIRKINVYEVYNPGAIVRISTLNESIMTPYSKRW